MQIPQLLLRGPCKVKYQYWDFRAFYGHPDRELQDRNLFYPKIQVRNEWFLIRIQPNIVSPDEKTKGRYGNRGCPLL
jgi:hypothetical protein